MDAYLPWFILKYVPGIGNHLYKRLIERFGSPEHVFDASPDKLLEVEGITPRLIAALRQASLPDEAQKDLDLVAQKGYRIVCLTDPVYPPCCGKFPIPLRFYMFPEPLIRRHTCWQSWALETQRHTG